MKFGIEKWAMLIMESGKLHMTEGMELLNQEKIRTPEENATYKYLGKSKADTIKHVEMKEIIKKGYLWSTRKLLITKIDSRNLIKGINTWAIPLVRYSRPFFKWIGKELKQTNQRTRKLMMMHKALDPRDDVDRLYMKKRRRKRTYQH